MSSTRNKNTYGNYQLENNDNVSLFNTIISNARIYPESYIAGEGLLGGSCPMNIMSNNSVDIETSLLGIGSTNLVDPKPVTIDINDFKKLRSLNVCDKLPLVMPNPLTVQKGQRPL